MNSFGHIFVSNIKSIKATKFFEYKIGVFVKANEYTSDINMRCDYDDLIVKQFIRNIGIIDAVNLERNVVEAVNNFEKNFLHILKDCVNALNCEIDPNIIDFSKNHSPLILELLIARTIESLGDNYSGSNYKEFIEYLKSNGIYGGIFKKGALTHFLNHDKCKEIFEILNSFKNKKTKIEDRQFDRVKSPPSKNTNSKISIVIDDSDGHSDSHNSDKQNSDKQNSDQQAKKGNTSPSSKESKKKQKDSKSNYNIKFCFKTINEEDLALFNLNGLKNLCDRLEIDNLPKKMSRKEYEDVILSYSFSESGYIL